jgi:cyanophycin synthetase
MQGFETVREHVAGGGLAVTCVELASGRQIVVHDGARSTAIIDPALIPATLMGTARFNVENALAAVAIATGLGIAPEDIQAALSMFHSSFEQNPGRMNIYDEHGFRVVMDYAHNPAALEALLDVLRQMRPRYNRMIGTVSTPGDRRTEDIKEMGRISARDFDLLVFRELPDNRGRLAGEVLSLLREGAIEGGADPRKIICVGPEEEATEICLRSARPGDLVVLMPTKVAATWQQMRAFTPTLPPVDRPASHYEAVHA